MDPHRRAELRSLAYHRAIAARLDAEPRLIERARARVETWGATGDVHPRYAALWADILAQAPHELKAALVADTEIMKAARQSTPFAGALSPRERWALFRSVAP